MVPKRIHRGTLAMMTRHATDARGKAKPAAPSAALTKGAAAVASSAIPDAAGLANSVGKQVRTLRRSLDLTSTELARRAKLSVGMLSKIESGQSAPSFATLTALALALDVPVARLFAGFERRSDCSIVKAGQGVLVERRGTKLGHRYELLGHMLSGEMFVEPYLITLTDEAEPYPSFQHTGLEFLYMLSGEMTYRYADRLFDLAPGDALLFDATAIHGPEQLRKRPVRCLSAVFNLRA